MAGPTPRALPSHGRRRGPWLPVLVVGGVVLAGAGIAAAVLLNRKAPDNPAVLLHKVKREALNVNVTEKGTIESADNRDVVCKVRAGSKGFASTINWVIEDGARVEAGQLLMVLDDSALQDQSRAQRIVVDQANSAEITSKNQYEITVVEGARAVREAHNALFAAEIDLERFMGLRIESGQIPLASVAGIPAALVEGGGFRQQLDDLTGQVRMAESDLEQNRERSAWADRMVKLKYMSSAQAQAERSKMESSTEKLRGLTTQRSLLLDFDRKKLLSSYRGVVENALATLDKQVLSDEANRATADIDRKTKFSIHRQEKEKLKEIEDQIHECKILSPQRGMVVYFKNESNRFGSNPQNLIEQGAQVKEGQKLLRIPNLDVMQVNTKVHEAMVSRIKGDVRVSTGLVENLKVGMLANPNPFARVVSQHEDFLDDVRNKFRDKEYVTARKGQDATVRVDALPDVVFPGRVRMVAGVASQADSFLSDVKLYQTLVLIEKDAPGLKPDMTAEVTIHVNGIQNVLAVPLQAVVGGAEMGAKRKLFVHTAGGYEEKEVTLGLYNEKMVEVRDGLAEGDEVVLNPKVLPGDNKGKTRDADAKTTDAGKSAPDGAKSADDEGGKKKGGKKKGSGLPPVE